MRPINLLEPIAEYKWYQIQYWPFFMLAFRPMFLCAAIWAILSVALWAGVLAGELSWRAQVPATLWHAHEMIFAFSGAVASGFLLTAAQNWTNVPSVSGFKLGLLVAIWCLTRYVFFVHPNLVWLVLIGQLTFWLTAIAFLSTMLLRAKSKNNYIFIVILSVLCIFNALFLLIIERGDFVLARSFTQVAVLMFMLLIGIIGGRVIPFFTARGLALDTQIRTPKLDRILLWVSIFGVTGFVLSEVFRLPLNPGYLLALAALLHLTRSVLWFNRKVLAVSLLWSLHLGYAFGAVGLLLLASHFFSPVIAFADALHLITLGGIGLLIIAMMARVSLGHTGRPLQVNATVNAAFLMIALAAICRAFLPYLINPHHAWLYSAALWCVGFALFVRYYFTVLTQKRVDGRRG
ncbi:NnrS family protein [Pseudoalteromonas sp. MMG022]|uniref:NnrS family protein n=1 Tax=Pseudoalteromonas sp. MMG022 TaxID=2909978 RepID=UPI001F29A550|nr:NnrS family protein [Pseudoalteromonas sp. MMG022]MCF6436675.1 NnrS family protein [Pseudoalteromonas sp. MMG022]